MSFDKHSNFNKQANFTEVKFGENKPVLEVELNELQQIQNEARADIVRDTIPSGFTKLGEIDYDFCLNNENQIKLKTDSVAYVNGYRINIPKDTIIDIGKAPEKDAREDLLFLEVWKEEVNSTGELTLEGGEGQVEIPNNIKDSRYPIETTHRVALKWRIRHHANADFVNLIEGLYCPESVRYEQTPFAQGGLDSAYTFEDMDRNVDFAYVHRFRPASKYYTATDWTRTNNDVGLYVAGGGNYPGITEMHRFKSFDGYVYAIPMFRLYRKPSCGKSIPFEYSKINPKVDYGKFTHLMKDDKVERVISENIKGRSLVNLDSGYYNCQYNTGSTINMSDIPNGKRFTKANATKDWQYLFVGSFVSRLKPSTTYTMAFKYDTNKPVTLPLKLSIQQGSATNYITSVTFNDYINGLLIGTFTTPSTFENVNQRLYMDITSWSNNDWCEISEMQVFEGIFSYDNLPKYFTGLKSLGEDDGNLITIKNGILNDDTYDINDGNQKLNTFPSVTHVLSENTIIPTIEAVVNKGDDSTPLEKLNSKLETEGNEIVEFTKIKGRTLQNLSKTKNGTLTYSPVPSSDFWISLVHSLKANTDYTLIFDMTTNTLDASFKLALQYEDTVLWKNLTTQGKLGEFRYVFNADTPISIIRVYTDNSNSGKVVLDNIRLVEGNYSDFSYENLPYIEGMKSLGENENNKVILNTCGKNLYRGISANEFNASLEGWYFLDGKGSAYGDMSNRTTTSFKLPKGRYRFNYKSSHSIRLATINDSISNWNQNDVIELNSETELVFRVKAKASEKITFSDLYIEEGTTLSSYEPYIGYKQEIYLKEPLRSLPNGVCDELVGNKVIRRVGKVILDGSTDMRVDTAFNQSNTIAFVISNPGLRNKDNGSLLSSLLPHVDGDTYWNTDIECIMSANELYFKFRVLKTKLDSLDNDGMQKWLKSNPITVYYELLNPIDEYLENVYEKESIKTYQLDAPLRSLPNGVKDEIKDGVLIRRVGEKILNGTENWGDENSPTIALSNVTRFILTDNTLNIKLDCHLMPNDRYLTSVFYANEKEGIYSDTTVNNRLWIHVLKTNLEAQDTTSLKKWLQSNPVKFIYELATPVETRLKEVKPQNANFSLQRQFAEGNWLRELPNGVKDTVENGKVIRRVGKMTLNGTEDWKLLSTSTGWTDETNVLAMDLKDVSTMKVGAYFMHDNPSLVTMISVNGRFSNTHYIATWSKGNNLVLGIRRNLLSSQDLVGLKAWLSANPITLLYELSTPTEEALTNENCKYFPVHDFNTYCGSMYVGEGRNYVISDNKMPSENTIVVETDFREIDGNSKVEDCKYKKNDEGYDTMCLLPTNKNLFDGIWEKGMINTDGSISEIQSTTRKYSKNFIRVIPGKTYVFSTNLGEDRINLKGYDLNKKLVHNFSYNAKHTIPEGCYFVRFYNGHDSSVNLDNIKAQFELGETATSYVEGINTFRSFENTESNDIDDLRHQVSLTGFNYDKILNESFDKLLRGEL